MKLIECPRDAMQGLETFIPTDAKVRYINQLMKVGFDTIDFGSFVSPKLIPQMRDTFSVIENINFNGSKTKLLAIVANTRGALEACKYDAITYLGFPLSVSETFQLRNTNKNIGEALNSLEEIKNACDRSNKKLVTYISMGFGNPYNDPYDADLVIGFVDVLKTLGSDVIAIADTIGASSPQSIASLFGLISQQYPKLEIGAHLHSTPHTATEKIEAAYKSGCKRFDGAVLGFGGCPMAEDELVGNLATEKIIDYLESEGVKSEIDMLELGKAIQIAGEIFPIH
jgi:hydroxymethylglutaryl-CoA lyase